MEKIDRLDKKILSILSKNARMPFKDVAAECGVSRAAIHQRVTHLMEAGIITGSGSDRGWRDNGQQIRRRPEEPRFLYLYLCGYHPSEG